MRTQPRLLAAALTAVLALGGAACTTDPADEAIDDAGGQTTVDPGTDTGATGEGFDAPDVPEGGDDGADG